MKIQCDVCSKDEAAVFCTADEAALCGGCDHRVHDANKLASKHQRFSFLSPSSKEFPVCDVCQEKRAFLFCQQDRAILCRECDVLIHSTNEHTQKHNRFLLTGVKLSATSALYASPAGPPASIGFDTVPDFRPEASSVGKPPTSASMPPPPPKSSTTTAAPGASPATVLCNKEGNNNKSLPVAANQRNGSTSSISEYLIEMLPGWHFEDFIDSCSASLGFSKNGDEHDGLLPVEDGDYLIRSSSPPPESLGIWVPQASAPLSSAASRNEFSAQINGFKEGAITMQPVTMKHNNNNNNNKSWNDDIFAVPQISPPPSGLKRPRHRY